MTHFVNFFIILSLLLGINITLQAQEQAAASLESEAELLSEPKQVLGSKKLPLVVKTIKPNKATHNLAVESPSNKLKNQRVKIRKQKKLRRIKPKYKKHKSRLAHKRYKTKKTRKAWTWGGRLDLDWLMVILAIILPAGLIAALYILFGGMVMSFFQMFLFALGFGFAFFSFWFLVTENNFAIGLYDFFVKYGLFSWPGVFALLAGFVALFGGTPSFLSYLLIGAIIGGISLIVSLIIGETMFNTLTY